jgi:hypothetical protein
VERPLGHFTDVYRDLGLCSIYIVVIIFGLWRVCFPPCLVRPGRRLPVQGLSELEGRGPVIPLDFGVFAFLSFSLGPAGDCPCRH